MATLVVPLDGSTLSENAIPWATLLARTYDDSLTLTRVAPIGRRYSVDLAENVREEHVSDAWKDAGAYLGQIKQQLLEKGIDATIEVREGIASAQILKVVADTGASAIVMSTHGRGGFRRALVGSVADEVLRESQVPVIVIPASVDRLPGLTKILVPLDGSRLAESAIVEARRLGGDNAKLALVRVVQPIEAFIDDGLFTQVSVDEDATQRSEMAAEAYLRDIAERLGSAVVTDTLVLRGRTADEIALAAQMITADLIVMNTHGYAGLRRLRMGSVATEVIARGPTPVALVTARMLAARGEGAQAVHDVMSPDFVSLTLDELVASAARRMTAAHAAVAPVVDRPGTVVGVLSVRDLLAWETRRLEDAVRGDSDHDFGQDTVAQILREEGITVDAGATLPQAIAAILDHQLEGLVIVRNNRPVGTVSAFDLLAATSRQARAPALAASA